MAHRAQSEAKTILLVDDEPALRELVRVVLKMNGYRVLEANSGQEALHLIEADPDSVDLLLTDIIMPDMNGQELAERTHRLHPEIKVLLISGYTDRSDFHEWAARLGVVFLPKPFNVEELERTVREVLDGFCPVHEPPLPASALSWTIP